MKNALLALALFAFVGTASATDGKDKDKKGAKKENCSAEMKAHCASKGATAGTPACCMKKGASAAASTAPAAKPVAQ
ncbi:hypothetical protein [Hymenobacter jeollabukensis]|uniref:Phosphate starvation-inducible protein PsiF n=1 Tax=Hymenobacter jeollabukensis TaxID=2025313 RepID=A0A5R8WP48_9BACT|nr:hypothetical protein [Hymenobacter jeollabukensis]TLM91746.1 hypothetical protein FDY95_14390 [Hymenobacter jeollabukensis]